MLAAEVVGMPVQYVAEEHRGFVVEVVARRDRVVVAVYRGLVEEVALGQSAGAARYAARGLGPARNVEAVLVADVDLDELQTAGTSERAGILARLVAVVTDAEAEIQPVGLVAEVDQEIPQPQRVLATRHGDEYSVAALEQCELLDRLCHLIAAQFEEVLGTELGVVPSDVDDRRLAAHGALHCAHPETARPETAPPEITGRTSTLESSAINASPGTNVPSTITRWDSRLRPSRSSNVS